MLASIISMWVSVCVRLKMILWTVDHGREMVKWTTLKSLRFCFSFSQQNKRNKGNGVDGNGGGGSGVGGVGSGGDNDDVSHDPDEMRN